MTRCVTIKDTGKQCTNRANDGAYCIACQNVKDYNQVMSRELVYDIIDTASRRGSEKSARISPVSTQRSKSKTTTSVAPRSRSKSKTPT